MPQTWVVWEASIDEGAYKCIVTRFLNAVYGVLIVIETGSNQEILREKVELSYDATVGPGTDEVELWQAMAVKAIDHEQWLKRLVTPPTTKPRDILAEQIDTWIESSDAPYDYADKLISALDSAGYSIRQNKCSVPGCEAHDIYLTCVLHGLHIDNG